MLLFSILFRCLYMFVDSIGFLSMNIFCCVLLVIRIFLRFLNWVLRFIMWFLCNGLIGGLVIWLKFWWKKWLSGWNCLVRIVMGLLLFIDLIVFLLFLVIGVRISLSVLSVKFEIFWWCSNCLVLNRCGFVFGLILGLRLWIFLSYVLYGCLVVSLLMIFLCL